MLYILVLINTYVVLIKTRFVCLTFGSDGGKIQYHIPKFNIIISGYLTIQSTVQYDIDTFIMKCLKYQDSPVVIPSHPGTKTFISAHSTHFK